MKITAINGSPRGRKSTTYIMIEAFLKGAKELKVETNHIILSEYNIQQCSGCLSCWRNGKCFLKDDFEKINFNDSDIVIFASPLYADNVTGLLKTFMDRNVARLNPIIENDKNNEAIHSRKKNTKIIAMSNCGYPGLKNFDGLKVLFRRIARNSQAELIAEIYRDEGPLFNFYEDKTIEKILENYKELLQKAGKEIAQNLKIKNETKIQLEKPLIPYDLYIQNHNSYFKDFSKIR